MFGNGLPITSLASDADTMDAASFAAKHGAAFLLLEDVDGPESPSEQRTVSSVLSGSKRTPTVVFPLVRKAESRFDFVSVGRHENNDVHLPAASVSRFHAYLRQQAGEHTLQDAGSRTGTLVDGVAVPRQGDGPAVTLRAGVEITFGDVRATFVTAELFLELARTVLRSP